MNTGEILESYLQNCRDLGKSAATIQTYRVRLRHFAEDFPELPTSTASIERFLGIRGETPKKRGPIFGCLQAFYSYIEKKHGIKSPVPSKGKVGRPHVNRIPPNQRRFVDSVSTPSTSAKLVQGGYSASSSTSISTQKSVQNFLISRKNKGCTQNTLNTESYHLKKFAEAFDEIPMQMLEVGTWLGKLPLDQESKWTYQKTIVALYHFLERNDVIPPVIHKLDKISCPTKVRPTLSTDQLQRLVKGCEDKEERAVILTLMDSKIRIGELMSLDRENIYPDYLMVKGKVGERIVPVKPETSEALCRLAKKGPLFKLNGRRMKMRTMAKRINRLMLSVGLTGKKLGPHIIRHSMSNLHVDGGGDLLTLQAELGHTTLRMTEKYAKLNPAQIRRKHGEYDVLGHVLGTAPAAVQPAPTLPPAPAAMPVIIPAGIPAAAGRNNSPAGDSQRAKPDVKPSAIDAAREKDRGLSGWGELLIIGPKKKPAPAPEPVGSTGQLGLGI